jgi:glutathione S-transferase
MFMIRHAGIACDEVMLPLEGASFLQDVAKVSPTGRLPVLVLDDGTTVWDSLAIGLTLAELFPEKNLFPREATLRRLAYSACSEMHTSFLEMRRVLTCNARKRYAPEAWRKVAGGAAAEAAVMSDVQRVQDLWRTLLGASKGPFLAGEFSYVDAFFVPVVSRFRTYGLALDATSESYCQRVEALPTYQEWLKESQAEPNVIAKYEYAI